MTKKELVAVLAERMEITKKDADACVNTTLDIITETLSRDEEVNLYMFGKFENAERAERMGRNPQTGETIVIPATKTPVFKFSKSVKDEIKEALNK